MQQQTLLEYWKVILGVDDELNSKDGGEPRWSGVLEIKPLTPEICVVTSSKGPHVVYCNMGKIIGVIAVYQAY